MAVEQAEREFRLPSITPPASPGYAASPIAGPRRGKGLSAATPLGKSASEPALQKSGSRRTDDFVKRQFQHSSVEARANLAHMHRQLIQDGKLADDKEFWGAKGIDGFRVFLERKHGSIMAGWRALDRRKTGRVSFQEFCKASREMGYHGNFKKLWGEMDVKATGFITLMELDPDVGECVGKFKSALKDKHGDLLQAWRGYLDSDNRGRIDAQDIEKAVTDLGLDVEPNKLYRMLVTGPEERGLTLLDFDPDTWIRFSSGEAERARRELSDGDELGEGSCTASLQGGPRAYTVPDGPRKWRLQQKERAKGEDPADTIRNLKAGVWTVGGFKDTLVLRCGSLLGAWKEALDLDGNGRLTFGEFCKALSRLGIFGDVKTLWKNLDAQQAGYILFRDLDPETDAALSQLRDKCQEKYSNMLLAWLKAFDSNGDGMVNEGEFTAACEKVGFAGKAQKLFKGMQPDTNRRFLTLRDFDTAAFLALSRGDFRMISEPDHRPGGEPRPSPADMGFHERQESGFFYQIRRSWEASRRAEFSKACRLENPEHLIDTKIEFEELCRRKYGSIIAAWHNILDWDQNGRLTFNEFCRALRRLGYVGDFRSLWQQYDREKKGHVLLKDIDPEADELVSSFLLLLAGRYGDVDSAWRLGFGKDPHDSLDEGELREACEALRYPHDARKLFRSLEAFPGRQLVTVWDLDPLCTRERRRGDVRRRQASEPKSLSAPLQRRPHFPAEEGSVSTLPPTSSLAASSVLDGKSSPLRVCRQALRNRHGSTAAAWRVALDPRWQGTVSFGKLVIVLEDCAFYGNVKRLWEDLSEGRPGVTLRDIDADTAGALDGFREQLLGRSGSILGAWQGGLDVGSVGRADEAEFTKGCEKLGITVRSPKRIFRLLLGRPGQRSVTSEDLKTLLIGVPRAELKAVWSGVSDEDPLQEDSLMSASRQTLNTMSNSSSKMPADAVDPLSPRGFTTRINQDHHGKHFSLNTLEGFKKMLAYKYGSLYGAWRRGLDVDQNGIVTEKDFAAACRELGVQAVQKLWAELDVNKDGQISLSEIDPEGGAAFAELEKLLVDRHGSTKAGWKRVFDADGNRSCNLQKFVEQCKALGFSGDAAKLFKKLKPEAGRRDLTYEDVWPNYDPNCFQSPGDNSAPEGLNTGGTVRSKPAGP